MLEPFYNMKMVMFRQFDFENGIEDPNYCNGVKLE